MQTAKVTKMARPRNPALDRLFKRPNENGDVGYSWLADIDQLIPRSEFYYLAGGMTGLSQSNFPAFYHAAGALRRAGYVIVSPAELEHEEDRRILLQAKEGEEHPIAKSYVDCLSRDLVIVSHPNCVGVVCLDGWHNSNGAQCETFVADSLSKPVFTWEYPDKLTLINRDEFIVRNTEPST